MEPLLTAAEVKQRLRCSLSNVYNLVAQGRLKPFRIGAGNAGLRFTESMVREFLENSVAMKKKAPRAENVVR
jgi:excisionase family DNA binding protein